MFAALSGQRIPGGCDDCDAYQAVTQQHGMHVIVTARPLVSLARPPAASR